MTFDLSDGQNISKKILKKELSSNVRFKSVVKSHYYGKVLCYFVATALGNPMGFVSSLYGDLKGK